MPMRIEGAREIQQVLLRLPEQLARRAVGKALRAGATVLRRGLRRRVRKRTGALSRSIAVGSRAAGQPSSRRSGVPTLYIGFRGRGRSVAHLIEFGTARAPAYPFIRPTVDEDGKAAIERIGEVLGVGVEEEAKRLAASYKTLSRSTRRALGRG